jgi:hypothetical protein
MRKFIAIVTLALAACCVVPAAVASADSSIVVTPGSGTQDDTFTFVGSGFAPGQQLSELFVSPEGTQYTYQINGENAVLVASDEGTFATSVFPRNDFAGSSAGDWIVRFCEVDTGNCYSTTITIALQ